MLRAVRPQRADIPAYTVDTGLRLQEAAPVLFLAEDIARLNETPLPGLRFDLDLQWVVALPGPAGGVSDTIIASHFFAGGDFCAIASLGIYGAPTSGQPVTCVRINRFLDLRGDRLFGRDEVFPHEPHLLLGLFCALSAQTVRLAARAYRKLALN